MGPVKNWGGTIRGTGSAIKAVRSLLLWLVFDCQHCSSHMTKPRRNDERVEQKTIQLNKNYFYGFLYIVQQTLSNTWDCGISVPTLTIKKCCTKFFNFSTRGTSSWGKGDPPANVRLEFILLLVVSFWKCICVYFAAIISSLTFESLFFWNSLRSSFRNTF